MRIGFTNSSTTYSPIAGEEAKADEEYVKTAADIAAYHHEKYDGTGYPSGLKGNDIPLSARIMAIADVFDALVSPRCYKEPFPVDEAFDSSLSCDVNEKEGLTIIIYLLSSSLSIENDVFTL